jgi:hypothetical protein
MGRHSTTGGVLAFGQDRIQFEFQFEGRRFRPTLLMTPTALNLRRARESLRRIKARIAAGTLHSRLRIWTWSTGRCGSANRKSMAWSETRLRRGKTA